MTEQQRAEIRDEEYFRQEVRKELAGQKPPPTFSDRCQAFFETKTGFWLLTVVLASAAGTGFAYVQRWIDRDEIASRDKIERSRRDTDTMLKLAPMLTSEKRNQMDVAIILLEGLAADKAVDDRVAKQIRSWSQNIIAAGQRPDATPDQKQQFDALIANIDRVRIAAVQSPEVEVKAAPAVPALADAVSLPARVYLQIGDKADRPRAEAASAALKKAGLIVPGIELVPAASAPKKVSDLRYCEGKIDAGALDGVKAAVATALTPPPNPLVLSPKMCGNVRFNHFEIWIARQG